MILCFVFGYALAVVVGFAAGVRFRLRASGAEREVRQLRSEIAQLKKNGTVTTGGESRIDPEGSFPAGDQTTRIGGEATVRLPGKNPDSGA